MSRLDAFRHPVNAHFDSRLIMLEAVIVKCLRLPDVDDRCRAETDVHSRLLIHLAFGQGQNDRAVPSPNAPLHFSAKIQPILIPNLHRDEGKCGSVVFTLHLIWSQVYIGWAVLPLILQHRRPVTGEVPICANMDYSDYF